MFTLTAANRSAVPRAAGQLGAPRRRGYPAPMPLIGATLPARPDEMIVWFSSPASCCQGNSALPDSP